MELQSRLLAEDNVLLVTLHTPATTAQRALLAREIGLLAREHRPDALVIALGQAAGTPAAISVILRIHRYHLTTGIPFAAASRVPAVRHLLNANQPSLPVHANTNTALRTVRTLLRRRSNPRTPQPRPGSPAAAQAADQLVRAASS
ncbi:hypothetical protein ACIPW5_06700 [Streptomyces sp. NPDC090077]|uniref:hypothetical protein n=1 Tax=Streptomyces sp. NPDC090077 TaxID=3365938 RepID=UPI0037FE49C0